MAKHKSATEVTVVTEERSSIQRWVDQHWGKALLIGLIIAGAIVYRQYSNQSKDQEIAKMWNPLLAAEGDLQATQQAVMGIENQDIKGWGYAKVAMQALIDQKPEPAVEALNSLAGMEGHLLNSKLFPTPGDSDKTLAQHAASALKAQMDWEAAHPGAMSNPDPASGSPVVIIKTAEGDVEITLYQEKAPKHVENFLKLVDEDYYDGILFHRVVNQGMQIVQAGDPNTREEDITQWGQGGPDYSIKAEKNGLMHVEGVLAAARPPSSPDSSGSQFYITLDRAHNLDTQYTVFGKVTAGLDVARKILEAPIRDADPETGTKDIPVNPVAITSVERK